MCDGATLEGVSLIGPPLFILVSYNLKVYLKHGSGGLGMEPPICFFFGGVVFDDFQIVF